MPLHVAPAGMAVELPPGDEQQVRQAVQVAARGIAYVLLAAERDEAAFRAPADRAREVRGGRGARAARQDEFLEGREAGVPPLARRFEASDLSVAEHGVARNAHLAAEIEEVVLYLFQRG